MPLEGVACRPRILLDELEIVLQRPFPIQFLVFLRALQARDRAQNIYGLYLVMHSLHLYPSTSAGHSSNTCHQKKIGRHSEARSKSSETAPDHWFSIPLCFTMILL
jgi:hypothetical protein